MNFSHLHVHCEKSWFDGIIKIPNMIKKVANDKMESVALTDHHHVMGWFELELYARKSNVKPIFGIELNVMSNHLTALAMNEKGMQNIIKLNNLAHKKNKVKVEEKELFQYKEGIFFLTGCSKGKIYEEYFKNGVQGIHKVVKEYSETFGMDFGIEMTNPNLPKDINEAFYLLQKKGALIVPTNDCHFLEVADDIVYQQNMWLKTRGKIISDNHEKYFKTQKEMEKDYPKEWLKNTMIISERCNVSYQEYCKDKIKKEIAVPVCEIERFTDEESMKIVYLAKKDYRAANKVFNHMKQKCLKLEDLLNKEEYHKEANIAFGLRNTIKKVKESKRYCVLIDLERHPILKTKRTGKIFSQWTKEEAEEMKMKVSKF